MKRVCRVTMAVVLSVAVLTFSGCGLVKEAAVEAVRESMGDEYADAYAAEYDAAMAELEREWDKVDEELKAEMKDEYEAMKVQLKEEWDSKKEELKNSAESAIQEELGTDGETAKALADKGIQWIDSLFKPKWDYPLEEPYCNWTGYKEETWSWSEWEMTDPNGQGNEYHLGIDIKSRTGNTDIYAAANGTVVFGKDSPQKTSGNGYKVVIEHELDGEKIYSIYSHLAKTEDMPEVGTEVKRGEKIGTMGSTGVSSGPHLHFAVYKANGKFNPHGRTQKFTGNIKEREGYVFYNPKYIIENDKLPE